jgi:hypothetical protein
MITSDQAQEIILRLDAIIEILDDTYALKQKEIIDNQIKNAPSI